MAKERQRSVVVVGGGVSGLAAAATLARRLEEAGAPRSIIVCERESAVGGKARTLAIDGFRIETGPTAFLPDSPILDATISAVGLDPRRVTANDEAKRRFLVRRGRVREVPAHPLRFACSGLLGPTGLLRMLAEPFIAAAPPERAKAESVWRFARRRLGRQAADRLIAPMVLGVYAGDPKELSLAAAFPKMAALEREHGSLIRGLIAKKRAAREAGTVAGGPSGPAGSLGSFTTGLEELPRALASTPGVTVRTGITATAVVRNRDHWRVAIEGGDPIAADAVILAGESWAMAPLVEESAPTIAGHLAAIDCPPVTVVALGYAADSAVRFPHGFGALVPRGEGFRMLGTLWDGRIFGGRAPDGMLLVRALYGGAVDREAASLDDDTLTALAHDELTRLFALPEPPRFTRTIRWPRAIPQYDLAHLARQETVRRALTDVPGLAIAGNALWGIAFGKAVESGVRAAEEIERFLGRASSTPMQG